MSCAVIFLLLAAALSVCDAHVSVKQVKGVAAAAAAATAAAREQPLIPPLQGAERPLVSVIVPTYNRPSFLLKTIERILFQSYTNTEIIVVDDSEVCLEASHFEALVTDNSILQKMQYHCLVGRRYSVGEKRNFALKKANGAIIALYDDDDFYSRLRIEQQLAQLQYLKKDIMALHFTYVLDLYAHPIQLYELKDSARSGPHFSTIMFKKNIFDKGITFPNTSFSDDYTFVERAIGSGAKFSLSSLPWCYLKHESSWSEFNVKDPLTIMRAVPRHQYPTFIGEGDVEYYTAMSTLLRSVAASVQLEGEATAAAAGDDAAPHAHSHKHKRGVDAAEAQAMVAEAVQEVEKATVDATAAATAAAVELPFNANAKALFAASDAAELGKFVQRQQQRNIVNRQPDEDAFEGLHETPQNFEYNYEANYYGVYGFYENSHGVLYGGASQYKYARRAQHKGEDLGHGFYYLQYGSYYGNYYYNGGRK